MNKFVVADPNRCISCRTCMAACIMKHDVPKDVAEARLNVVNTQRISTPVACHHCADAPCAAACPTGALYQDAAHNRVGVREENCIGCRSCVMACPYGAVDVVAKPAAVRMGDLLIGARTKASVIKCDLCVDRPGGPACVEACPTKGLRVVTEEELYGLVMAKEHAAAGAQDAPAEVATVAADAEK